MRRKLALFLTCTALLLPLTGCGKDQPETSSGSSPYVDGTYQARFDTPQDGYTDYVRLSIQNGAITVEEFDGVNSSGALKSADSALKSEMEEAAPENLPYKLNPGTAYQTALANLIAAGGDTGKLQFVPGAPEYSDNLAILVDAILDSSARQGLAEELTVPYYADGEYRVSVAEFDQSGYKEYIILTVQDGKPRITEFDALDEEQKLRSDDTQISPKVPYTQVTSALIDSFNASGTAEGIEGVAGATESSDCFRALAARALENAHVRGPAEDTVDLFGEKETTRVDGVYKAEMADFENGWKDYVIIAVRGDEVQVVELDSKNEQGSLKSADSALAESMEKAPQGTAPTGSPSEYLSRIIEAFYSAGASVTDMENIAGATVSTNNFKLMVGELLGGNARTGDTSVRIVQPLSESELSGEDSSTPEESSSGEAASA